MSEDDIQNELKKLTRPASHFHQIQSTTGRQYFKKCEVTTATCPLDRGTPEELGLWFGISAAASNSHVFLTWLERHRVEKTLLKEQIQRSDDLERALNLDVGLSQLVIGKETQALVRAALDDVESGRKIPVTVNFDRDMVVGTATLHKENDDFIIASLFIDSKSEFGKALKSSLKGLSIGTPKEQGDG